MNVVMVLGCLWTAMLAVATGTGMEVSMHSSLAFEASKKRPMSKVIKLLKDMLATMEKEGEEDHEAYDKMACWCITNKKEKTKAVEAADNHMSDLQTRIEEQTASIARLGAEIANLQKEVAEDQNAYDTAAALRKKQLKEFAVEEKDLLASISSLKGAIIVLEKSQSFLQSPRAVRDTMQIALKKQASQLTDVLTPLQKDALTAFVQTGAPSAEIFGILKQMKENFETNLKNGQTEEATNQKSFEDLKRAKENEIKAGQDQADSKAEELATIKEQNSQDQEDLSDTRAGRDSDEKFLAMLKEKCEINDSEWERRQKSRSEEMEAVSQALSTLTSDDAHDLFSKTLGFLQTDSNTTGFLQTECVSNRQKMLAHAASNFFQALAQKHHSPRLASLAIKVRLNAFSAVKKAIDEMVTQLAKEKSDEIKQKDFCTKALADNAVDLTDKKRDAQDVEGKIVRLTMALKKLQDSTDALNAELAEMRSQLKNSGEDRAKENTAYQQTVADQRATQKLLNQALKVLKGFYAKSTAASAALVDTSAETDSALMDTRTETAKTPAVLGMLVQIINDAKALEVSATRDEKDAQKAYEVLVKATNDSMKTKNKDIMNKAAAIAEKEAAHVTAKKDHESVDQELDMLNNAKAELDGSCSFLLANFDKRQKAQADEVEALQEAKSILSGAKFNSFLVS